MSEGGQGLSNIDKPFETHNTQKIIADELKWSTGKKGQADIVHKKAPEQVKEKLRNEEISINQGYEITKAFEKVPESKQEEFLNKVLNENKSVNKAIQDVVREEKKEELQKLEPPKGKYRVILADCPWSYGDKRAPSTGGCEDHYITMPLKEICDMPIKELAEDNAVLFLWATSPLIQDAFKVAEAWGFTYKAMFVWDKIKHNMGHYNSVRHELLLICTRGSCLPDNNKLYDSVQSIERTEKHSEKPEEFRNIIDDLYTHGNKIELFSRKKVDGWEVWGNQV
jgi:N6-adenosine-specific RNA methylase IME4